MSAVGEKRKDNFQQDGTILQQDATKKMRTLYPIPMERPPTLKHGAYTREELRAMVNEHGFCVIADVIGAEQTEQHRAALFAAYASIHDGDDPEKKPFGFDLRDPSTLLSANLPPYKGTGIVNIVEAAGLRELERIRRDAAVAAVFVKYYGVESALELAKANDRFGVMVPTDSRTELVPHVDGDISRVATLDTEDVLQGMLVLQRGAVADQGFVIYPGSHKTLRRWNTIANEEKHGGKDWFPVPAEDRHLLGQGYVINPPAGSMIVWLHAFHGNTTGAGKKTQTGRVVVYTAMYPWQRIGADAKKKIANAIVRRTTMNHHLLRPVAQKPGGGQWGKKINWRFAPEFLTNYESAEQVPADLLEPKPKPESK